MSILLFILIFIFTVVLLIFSMFRKVLSFLFGGFKAQGNQQDSGSRRQDQRGHSHTSSYSKTDTTKVFADNEGEYVSYEEVE